MNIENYYMELPKELAGSIAKNRFRLELYWGISKMIDEHVDGNDYTIVFDFKCDIEIHKQDEMDFYQIKTKKNGNYTLNELCKKKNNKTNSILGKLYALYSPNHNIKLAIVCNKQIRINKKEMEFNKQCFGELDKTVVEDIKEKLCVELNMDSVDSICLDHVFYIFDNMDLQNPENSIKGKLISFFESYMGEEPQNPNALFRLVSGEVHEKAAYEMDSATYNEVIEKKGINRNRFDKMLEAHKKQSKNGINETKEYIKNLSIAKQRRYNIALAALMPIERTNVTITLKKDIFSYIKENENSFNDIELYLCEVSKIFDSQFNVEFTDDMKNVLYLMIYFTYVSGGEII